MKKRHPIDIILDVGKLKVTISVPTVDYFIYLRCKFQYYNTNTYFARKFSAGRSNALSVLMARGTIRTHPWGFLHVFDRQTT